MSWRWCRAGSDCERAWKARRPLHGLLHVRSRGMRTVVSVEGLAGLAADSWFIVPPPSVPHGLVRGSRRYVPPVQALSTVVALHPAAYCTV